MQIYVESTNFKNSLKDGIDVEHNFWNENHTGWTLKYFFVHLPSSSNTLFTLYYDDCRVESESKPKSYPALLQSSLHIQGISFGVTCKVENYKNDLEER